MDRRQAATPAHRARLRRLVGSDEVRVTDREFMSNLQRKLEQEREVRMRKEEQARAKLELERQRRARNWHPPPPPPPPARAVSEEGDTRPAQTRRAKVNLSLDTAAITPRERPSDNGEGGNAATTNTGTSRTQYRWEEGGARPKRRTPSVREIEEPYSARPRRSSQSENRNPVSVRRPGAGTSQESSGSPRVISGTSPRRSVVLRESTDASARRPRVDSQGDARSESDNRRGGSNHDQPRERLLDRPQSPHRTVFYRSENTAPRRTSRMLETDSLSSRQAQASLNTAVSRARGDSTSESLPNVGNSTSPRRLVTQGSLSALTERVNAVNSGVVTRRTPVKAREIARDNAAAPIAEAGGAVATQATHAPTIERSNRGVSTSPIAATAPVPSQQPSRSLLGASAAVPPRPSSPPPKPPSIHSLSSHGNSSHGNDDSDVEEDGPSCRICQMMEETADNKLIEPCGCAGSLRYIHKECLKRWMETRHRQGHNARICELCHKAVTIDVGADLRGPDPRLRLEQAERNMMQSGLYILMLLQLCERRLSQLVDMMENPPPPGGAQAAAAAAAAVGAAGAMGVEHPLAVEQRQYMMDRLMQLRHGIALLTAMEVNDSSDEEDNESYMSRGEIRRMGEALARERSQARDRRGRGGAGAGRGGAGLS
ncbi:PREDICTED: E3 ubiquitin-protein ligase MARCH7-like [Branchiostoma belcheri]|uniref:RING-type E3 ubiquitin transferase n=1 Tax=Branchiostoma belcheri TaxID=7741 RepID=A0A6P5A2I4_BRABE|nr:PREDICTED: E3 ubiquitin-protein ligase MARCH7-like [Branchiostoma belcheri]